ncbi:MAG: SfiI family type II restriction endonuclease [Chloroflexus sp.]|nr:SfiI family type II restriction endonuclease [Chloroflexus sp.]
MILDPEGLTPNQIEDIEKATLRLVTQAIFDYRVTALEIFREETDLVSDIGEDITREALDRLGMPRIDRRLFGKVDYKQACYLFLPDYAIKQALFVDSKAEKVNAQDTATLQISQISMTVMQVRRNKEYKISGTLPKVITFGAEKYLTTTLLVKYNYEETTSDGRTLKSITVAAVPNGKLQDQYNPNPEETIWKAGRNAKNEEFRVRLCFSKLAEKAKWRVQTILIPSDHLEWSQ